jgi:hypothetical protein
MCRNKQQEKVQAKKDIEAYTQYLADEAKARDSALAEFHSKMSKKTSLIAHHFSDPKAKVDAYLSEKIKKEEELEMKKSKQRADKEEVRRHLQIQQNKKNYDFQLKQKSTFDQCKFT